MCDIIGQSIGRSDVVSKVEIIQIFPILEMSNFKHPTSNMKEQLSFFSFMLLLDFSHLKIGANLAQFSHYQNQIFVHCNAQWSIHGKVEIF